MSRLLRFSEFLAVKSGQLARRSFLCGVLIGALLVAGSPGWVVTGVHAKPPGGGGSWEEPQGIDTVFSGSGWDEGPAQPISVGHLDGWWLLVTGNQGPFPMALPDLDRDGLAEVGQAWDRTDYHELQIWFSGRGEQNGRAPDMVVAERFTNQTAVFSRIGATEDVDGDGVLELTTLGSVVRSVSGGQVPILSTYVSTTGLPAMTLFGSDLDIMMSVLQGRAVGAPADELLGMIREFDPLVSGFSPERLANGLASSLGTTGEQSSSYPYYINSFLGAYPHSLGAQRIGPDGVG
jgi:hypothetical protein